MQEPDLPLHSIERAARAQSYSRKRSGDVYAATCRAWDQEIAPTLDEFVADTTWKEVCRQHLWRRLEADQCAARCAQLGRWWDGQDKIDIVGLWTGRVTVVGECKWTAHPLSESVFAALQHKARKLPLADRPIWVLASRSGFDSVLRTRAL